MRIDTGYVIWVTFEVREGLKQQFLALVRENASSSVATEPGCRRFDVLLPIDASSNSVALYEIYDDEQAFHDHCQMMHFKEFDAASAPLVLSKEVTAFQLEENAK
jgi:quinol monooxygenase YgiN